jgi:hypothetical protein
MVGAGGDQTTMVHTLTTLGAIGDITTGTIITIGNTGVERATETAARAFSKIQDCWCNSPRRDLRNVSPIVRSSFPKANRSG